MRYALLTALFAGFSFLSGSAQIKTDYQGLLWEISGNGLEKPSYLYGTMHVSSRVAFHLGEDFFGALESADVIALETNPANWINQFEESTLFQDYYSMGYRYNSAANPLYKSFIPTPPKQLELGYYIGHDQELLNRFLYRMNSEEQNFSEDTFLDLFIYQAAKKQGKKVVALEDFEDSFLSVMKAGKYDKDAQRISERQAKDILGDYSNWYELQEDAYRKGNLDLLDTMTSALNPGKYYRVNMLDIRNAVMAKGMDSIMQKQTLFTGVGAAHLPGKQGVISMLRAMGYTVKAKPRMVTAQSIDQKETLDKLTFAHDSLVFTTDDGFISALSPAPLTKMVAEPFQEYVYPDMANGAFYSIRRVNTFGKIYGLSPDDYLAKVDSLLFENIPGKIETKNIIEINGYKAYDIRNTTKKGDKQRYHIIFTPLEIIIAKVGGPKDFVETLQPSLFFKTLTIGQVNPEKTVYTPKQGGFQVNLPPQRIELKQGVFNNPNATFWVQSVDDAGNYFALAERKQYDFENVEEDAFELTYFIERIAKEEKLTLDTLYTVGVTAETLPKKANFVLINKKGQNLHGQTHLQGNQYVTLFTTAQDAVVQNNYFDSFSFTGLNYPESFENYVDTSLYINVRLPSDPNNYERVINSMYSRGRNERQAYQSFQRFKKYDYPPTGESLLFGLEKLNKYQSYKTADRFWANFDPIETPDEYILLKDTLLSAETKDTNLFTSTKEYIYSDTASSRIIRIKAMAQNGAIYSLRAQYGKEETPSKLILEAFASFKPSADTLFGKSPLISKAHLIFADLTSGDSALIYGAANSFTVADYNPKDAKTIVKLYKTLQNANFKRDDRLNLLNRLAFTKNEEYLPFIKEEYYANNDSSTYQFMLLETLADYLTEDANALFAELILDETPFSSSTYRISSLFREFNDSLQIADALFPEILALADFEDYKDPVYSLLSQLVDSNFIKQKQYKQKRGTVLRYAKVEYKKQRASEETENTKKSNFMLTKYNTILSPFGNKKEVQEHYRNLLNIKNKQVLAEQLPYIYNKIEVPDTLYNYLAKDTKARSKVYNFLQERNKLNLLSSTFKTQEALGEAIVQNLNYAGFDSLSTLGTATAQTKIGEVDIYFYRVKNEKDKFWQFAYTAVPQSRTEPLTKVSIARLGERYNPLFDDLEEIKKDAIEKIKLYNRPFTEEEVERY